MVSSPKLHLTCTRRKLLLSVKHYHRRKKEGVRDRVPQKCDQQTATEPHPRSSFLAPCPSFSSSFPSGQPSSLWIWTTAVPHLTFWPQQISGSGLSGFPAQHIQGHLLTSLSVPVPLGCDLYPSSLYSPLATVPHQAASRCTNPFTEPLNHWQVLAFRALTFMHTKSG